MQKITISVLLALVAFVSFSSAFKSFSSAGGDVDLINVINLLTDFVECPDSTIDHLLDNNKLSQANRKDAKMAQLVKLLEKISKVNWQMVDEYVHKNKITFDGKLRVDGKEVEIQKMFKLLESVSKINWVTFAALFSSVSSEPRTPRPTPSKADSIDVKIITERLERIKSINWSLK